MKITRILTMTGLAVVLFAYPTFAGVIDFSGVDGGTFSYNGSVGGNLVGSGIVIDTVTGVLTPLHAGSHPVSGGLLSFTTGGLIDFANGVYTFGAGGANSFLITGGVADAGIANGSTLLSGQISSATLDTSTGTVHLFTTNGLDTKNATLVAYFGESATAWAFGPGTIHGFGIAPSNCFTTGATRSPTGPQVCDHAFGTDIPNTGTPGNDSHEPGSVIVFPKFIRGFVTVDGVATPRTEFEVGVVCPKGATCPERQTVKIRFHYVCGTDENPLTSFVCKETDFEAQVTVNGKLIFNPEATTPPGNFITPLPPCDRGYLIGWVEDTSDRPIKFDGLIGDAVLRESGTAVAAYKAITIHADPALATGALISLAASGGLAFDGAPGHYQPVTGVIKADVAYDKPTTPFKNTFLTLLTLDTISNRPNYPTFVDLKFYNAFEALLSTFTELICWREVQLSTEIDANLTVPGMGSRKGVVISGPAEKVPIAGIADTAGPVTLLGLVDTVEGPNATASCGSTASCDRAYIYGVFNDGNPVPTVFVP
jgi:hypothetical protein